VRSFPGSQQSETNQRFGLVTWWEFHCNGSSFSRDLEVNYFDPNLSALKSALIRLFFVA
jgi:hypothetical protein